jgi:hypothetical protein
MGRARHAVREAGRPSCLWPGFGGGRGNGPRGRLYPVYLHCLLIWGAGAWGVPRIIYYIYTPWQAPGGISIGVEHIKGSRV